MPLAGCAPAGSDSSSSDSDETVAATCAGWLGLSMEERDDEARTLLDRVADDPKVSDNEASLADQITGACVGDSSGRVTEMAALVMTIAKTNGRSDYDDPSPTGP